jgi:hypothetical protein
MSSPNWSFDCLILLPYIFRKYRIFVFLKQPFLFLALLLFDKSYFYWTSEKNQLNRMQLILYQS